MQKHLFLTGPTGVGKSTLLREVLGDRLAMAGGFLTRQVRDRDGMLAGCELLPAAGAAGVEGLDAQRFLSFPGGSPAADTEVFRRYGVQLLREAAYYPFALLDEFGSFELIIPQFRQALEELLNAPLPVVGALRTLEEAELFRQYLGLGERLTLQCRRLHEALESDPDTLVIEMRAPGDETARRALERWAERYLS